MPKFPLLGEGPIETIEIDDENEEEQPALPKSEDQPVWEGDWAIPFPYGIIPATLRTQDTKKIPIFILLG